MKKNYLMPMAVFLLIFSACTMKQSEPGNPLLNEFNTPFNVPPFDKIEITHFLPAYTKAIEEHKKEIQVIINDSVTPNFSNTIEALDQSGELLNRVSFVFDNLNSSNTNDQMQEIAKEIAPVISKHYDDILMNETLFNKVKQVYESKNLSDLTSEQKKLLEETYKNFVRGGANLDPGDKEKLSRINQELSVLSLQFGENVLAETNNYKLLIENEDDLAGLPESVRAAASEAATESGDSGKWVFTLHKPSLIPFLQYSAKRNLREEIFKAYINRGDNNNENDNKEIISKMIKLRIERANILGYKSHADYVLSDNMAKNPENVYKLLNEIWNPSLKVAKNEAWELQEMINAEGNNFKLEPWDWWYYAEKLKLQKYALDEEATRPYFQLEKVRDGVFKVVNKLYGLQFTEIKDIPKYHLDVEVYEVKESDGRHVGLLYMDFFPRAGKRAGAWMSTFQKQYYRNDKRIDPIVINVFNFSKPTGDKPALLTFEEVQTLFHEFGHGLHGLLSDCHYLSLSGTSVPRDFVELPSQIMENWAAEPEVLNMFAKHYQTGEVIPVELIDKFTASKNFNQGFALTEYLAASFLDMDYHVRKEPLQEDVDDFERSSLNNIGLIPEIVVRYRSTYFQHIFSGGYSSGYYSYIWAEVLDADAFQAFKENGLFDRKTAQAFRMNILEKGGSEDPMELYISFRSKEPGIEPLLKRKGLL